jgi:transcriptional regulator with XRE-family HTH domain
MIMSIYALSDLAVLRELGQRLRRRRLDQNLSQEDLAERTGLNRTTISGLERGDPATLLTFIQILRGLEALDELDAFLPDPGPSPLALAKLEGHRRQRASRPRGPRDGGDKE